MTQDTTPGRVIGIGGVFFKADDQKKLSDWYRDRLGMVVGPDGSSFEWRHIDDPNKTGLTAWSIFRSDSTYFDPSKSPFMVNYIVDNLDALLAKLSTAGVEIDPKRENFSYGRFAWIFDPAGNKIELWEPGVPFS